MSEIQKKIIVMNVFFVTIGIFHYEFLKAKLRSNIFVFLGFSLVIPSIRLLLTTIQITACPP